MLLSAFLYFENEKRLYFDLTKSDMQNTVSKISSKIILSHMQNTPFDSSEILNTNEYKISFYNEKKEKIFGNLDAKIDFSKDIIEDDKKHFILIDKSTLGHLDVFYIAIEENVYSNKIQELKKSIILFFLFLYSFISLVGYYLAKLFLKPIKEEREKLNNFIRDTTHELNTPITAILMSTEKENLSEKQIQRVRLSAKRVSEIYKDLTYIFLEKNDERKSCENISIDMLISEQLEYLKPLASKKRIKINTSLENFDYFINKDDAIRIVNNLISNAIKYNKVGGQIDISVTNKTLKITDSGIGIEKDKLNDIYKRYYRGTKEQGGFGIGLNIVSHICAKYNIKIDVESKKNIGTSFFLSF